MSLRVLRGVPFRLGWACESLRDCYGCGALCFALSLSVSAVHLAGSAAVLRAHPAGGASLGGAAVPGAGFFGGAAGSAAVALSAVHFSGPAAGGSHSVHVRHFLTLSFFMFPTYVRN